MGKKILSLPKSRLKYLLEPPASCTGDKEKKKKGKKRKPVLLLSSAEVADTNTTFQTHFVNHDINGAQVHGFSRKQASYMLKATSNNNLITNNSEFANVRPSPRNA
jgi:hypothetical protein